MRNRTILLICLLAVTPWASDRLHAKEIPHYGVRTMPATTPVSVDDEPQLFIDDYLVAESTNLVKTTHRPTRTLDRPILGWQQGTTQPYITVLHDQETKRFRMWYNKHAGRDGAIAYAESEDGVHWETPDLGILGSDNRLLRISSDFQNGYGVSVVDEGPHASKPERRYKMAWWGQIKPWPDGDPGMRVAFSPDGIHWTPFSGNPVLPDFSEDHFALDDPRRPYGVGDIIDVFWDPYRMRYGALVKTPAVQSDGYSPGPKARNYIRRLVSATTSEDFLRWERPWRVAMPESRDEGRLEFYSVGGTIARGGLLIGFVRMLRDDLPATEGGPVEGIGYATLLTSRDGVHWERHDDVFFDRHPDPDAWDHAMTWIGSVLPVGDELYIYYGGYKRGHKIEARKERQLGLARIPRDRFVSRNAAAGKVGILRTVPIKLSPDSASQLVLNADSSEGEIHVQLVDAESGDVIPGYGWNACRTVVGDGHTLDVEWTNGRQMPNRTIQLEFKLENAALFAFQVLRGTPGN